MQTISMPSTTTSLAHYTKDFLLRDGALLRVRGLKSEDRDKLRALFDRCSPETLRFRFLYTIKSLSEDLLNRLVEVDGAENLALVVTMGEHDHERIVGVGRYQTIENRPQVAEVSFLIEDAMQRRGIGTHLLDALAELARQHGITRFAADVLTDNRVMLSVFRKAGYGLAGSTSYGVTHLEFPIAQTELARARAEAQEAEAECASLRPVLAPHTIAVIGASRNPHAVGGALFRNLLRWGFQGTLYPINPAAKSIGGVRAYKCLQDLPETVELAFISVPAQHVLQTARDCAKAGVRALCVLTAGFAEVGETGRAAQTELLNICRASGMRIVGPNCLGLVNAAEEVRMLGTFAPMEPPAGNLAMSSQSGALGLALVNQAQQYGLGISSFVSTGNKADVSGNDLLQFWEADDATEVILLYLESFGNPRRFARIARRVARRKPIIAVKAGRTVDGARAASSHTAALASSDRAANALFAQTGIIRVDTLAQFFAVARLLSQQPIPAGHRVGILTNAGGPAILAVDAAEAVGLKIPTLSESTQTRLRQVLPATASVGNPVDMIASATPAQYRACLETMCDDPALDAVLVIFIPPLITPSAEVAQVISEVVSQRVPQTKPVLAVFLDPAAQLTAINAGPRKIPVYNFPESAIFALGAAARYGAWRAKPAGQLSKPDFNQQQLEALVNQHAAGWLPQTEVYQLLAAAGINIFEPIEVRSREEAAIAGRQADCPLVLKVADPAVLHKSDVGGVVLNVAPEKAAAGFDRLKTQLAEHQLELKAASLMPMAPAGVEVLAGITTDPVFGPLVAFGSGGVLVELLDDVVFRVLPLTDQDAEAMILETRAARLLKGFRGTPAADMSALQQLLLKLGALAEALPRLAEIDLNPVLVHPLGAGLSLIDARIRLS
jgi:acetyl coenzyme A synthetase (ADP forming)-like protein